MKLDSETLETKMWRRDVHYYVGEPVFVPLSEGRQFPHTLLFHVSFATADLRESRDLLPDHRRFYIAQQWEKNNVTARLAVLLALLLVP